MNNRKGISSVISLGLLLLLSIVVFLSFSSWVESIDSDKRIGVEEDSYSLEIREFKNDLLKVKSNANSNIETMKIQQNGKQICNLENISLIKGSNEISISSCSLNSGEVYDVLLLSSQSKMNSQTMVYVS